MWMEHSLSPKVQGDLAAWFGSVPSVPAACSGNELLTDEGCKANGFEDFDRISFWTTPVSKCASQGECVPYYRWVSDYIGVIGGR
jgi:putative spermidine/putrescine transport system substrate-binding protein